MGGGRAGGLGGWGVGRVGGWAGVGGRVGRAGSKPQKRNAPNAAGCGMRCPAPQPPPKTPQKGPKTPPSPPLTLSGRARYMYSNMQGLSAPGTHCWLSSRPSGVITIISPGWGGWVGVGGS